MIQSFRAEDAGQEAKKPPSVAPAGENTMHEFVTGLTQRIRETKARMQGAMIAEDAYAVQVEQAELDNLLRIAANHHVEVRDDLPRAA